MAKLKGDNPLKQPKVLQRYEYHINRELQQRI